MHVLSKRRLVLWNRARTSTHTSRLSGSEVLDVMTGLMTIPSGAPPTDEVCVEGGRVRARGGRATRAVCVTVGTLGVARADVAEVCPGADVAEVGAGSASSC